jgi:hypothetical protein
MPKHDISHLFAIIQKASVTNVTGVNPVLFNVTTDVTDKSSQVIGSFNDESNRNQLHGLLRQKGSELRLLRQLQLEITSEEKAKNISISKEQNSKAALLGSTLRFCQCQTIATLGIGRQGRTHTNPEGVDRWLCHRCFAIEYH